MFGDKTNSRQLRTPIPLHKPTVPPTRFDFFRFAFGRRTHHSTRSTSKCERRREAPSNGFRALSARFTAGVSRNLLKQNAQPQTSNQNLKLYGTRHNYITQVLDIRENFGVSREDACSNNRAVPKTIHG